MFQLRNKFWTIDPDRTTCGDTPCEGGYHFIGKKTTNLDFHQMLDRITKFLKKMAIPQ